MAHVRITLRVPSLTVESSGDASPKRIDNSMLRFLKTVELSAIPKAGAVLDMTAAAASAPFQCTVKQADWDDRENMFVVACSYAKSSIREADYQALLNSQDWVVKPLI